MAADVSTVEAESACWCFTGTKAESAIVYLLNQIAGGTMTKEEVEANSACWCFTGITYNRAVVYLLAQILNGGGGGGGSSGVTNLALSGSQPPTDGSVTTKIVFDTDTGYLWYNSGTVASPTWNNV